MSRFIISQISSYRIILVYFAVFKMICSHHQICSWPSGVIQNPLPEISCGNRNNLKVHLVYSIEQCQDLCFRKRSCRAYTFYRNFNQQRSKQRCNLHNKNHGLRRCQCDGESCPYRRSIIRGKNLREYCPKALG